VLPAPGHLYGAITPNRVALFLPNPVLTGWPSLWLLNSKYDKLTVLLRLGVIWQRCLPQGYVWQCSNVRGLNYVKGSFAKFAYFLINIARGCRSGDLVARNKTF
jgi:hypothetical protein